MPRRYGQRQTLCSQYEASLSDLRSQRQRHEPRTTAKQRKAFDLGSGSGSIIDDTEAEYLNELIQEFHREGPQVSNLGDKLL